MPTSIRVALVMVIGIVFCGCAALITQEELDRQIALTRAQYEQQLEALRTQIGTLSLAANERESLLARVDALQREFLALQGQMKSVQDEHNAATRDLATAKIDLAAAHSEIAELRRLRDEAERLTVEAQQIRERATAAEQERDQIRAELQKFIDLGAIGVESTPDGVMITMRESILFDSGKAELKPSSTELLAKIAQILVRSRSREIRVAGHTDNVPIQNAAFPSNWELSSARAMSVLHNLADRHRFPGSKLVAMGFGENRPVASNATAEGRARNRRVELYLVPDNR